MYNNINALLKLFASAPPGISSGEMRAMTVMKVGLPLGALVHASWVLMFSHLDLQLLAYWNIAATFCFAGAAVLVHKQGWLKPIVLWLGIFEVPLHGALATAYTGAETAFWVYPATSAVFTLAVAWYSWKTRFLISVTIVSLAPIILAMVVYYGSIVELSSAWKAYFVLTNALFGVGQLVLMFGVFNRAVETAEDRLTIEFDRAEGLLRNILPDPIATRLKDGEKVIADEHGDVSVIFADIVDFTAASSKLSPTELVETLNMVFSEFDRLAQKHHVEKIKTIGDSYMVVVGAPDERRNHAEVAVDMALDMMAAAKTVSSRTHFPIEMRVGVNSGPVVAGVIGTSKFAYDLWGDAVNVASRMEAHSHPGMVLITETTRQKLSSRFDVRSDGKREVKGKGQMEVYSVNGSQVRNQLPGNM